MDMKDIQVTEDKEILAQARSERNVTQQVLACKLNMLQNGLSMNLSRPRMSLGMFTKILNALEYDVVVVDRRTGEAEWKVGVKE